MTDSPHEAIAPEDTAEGTFVVAHTPSLSDAQRAAALRAGRTPVPTKTVLRFTLALAAVFAFASLLEHFLGNVGQPSTIPTNTTVATRPATSSRGAPPAPGSNAILGLQAIDSATAPAISLTDQHRRAWHLVNQTGHVVVLTFFDSRCKDICPVLGSELREANLLLGAHSKVLFAIVNTNPKTTVVSANPPALRQTGLDKERNVVFLNGSLPSLIKVWTNYGVQVRVSPQGQIAHNNVLYFISSRDHLNSLATPFGNESSAGQFTLGANVIHQFASAIARTATSLEHQ